MRAAAGFVLLALAVGVACDDAAEAAAAASGCQLIRIAEWRVQDRGHMFVDGDINGRRVAVAIDTGAMFTSILRPTAAELGLNLRLVPGARIAGFGGESRVETAYVDEITIAGTSLKGIRLVVVGEQPSLGRMDLVLGEDALYGADIEFDLAGGAVRLFQPKECDGVSLAYWTSDGASRVDIERSGSTHPRIAFTVEVNGRPLGAILDSGASRSLLNRSDAALVGVSPETPGVVAAGRIAGVGPNSLETWIGRFDSVVIGNERIRDAAIPFADFRRAGRHGSEEALFLGMDFLRTHRVLVSHSQRRMYFTYVGGAVFGEPARAALDAKDGTSSRGDAR